MTSVAKFTLLNKDLWDDTLGIMNQAIPQMKKEIPESVYQSIVLKAGDAKWWGNMIGLLGLLAAIGFGSYQIGRGDKIAELEAQIQQYRAMCIAPGIPR